MATRWGAGLVAVAITVVLSGQSPASATVGDLRVGQTIAHDVPGTVEIGSDVLRTARGTGVSPDGDSLYVVSSGLNELPAALSHFRRAPDGSLTFAGCIGWSAPCRRLPDVLFSSALEVVAHKDVVFVRTSGAVLVFWRSLNGDLTYASCAASFALPGCAVYENLGNHQSGLVVSPDSRDVYVTASRNLGGDSVVQLRFDVRSGTLGYVGCIGDGFPGCVQTVARKVLYEPGSLVMSSDGRSVYTGSSWPDVITHFRRDPATGNLREAGCIGSVGGLAYGLSGCTTVAAEVFRANSMDLTKVGDSVYLAAGQAVTHLRRDVNTGDLSYAGCIGHLDGCTVAGPDVQYRNVVTASDGRSVYLAAQPDGVVHYRRAANGDIGYAGCIGETDPAWCTQTGLQGPLTVDYHGLPMAVSPDSRNVYAVNYVGAITDLIRQTS